MNLIKACSTRHATNAGHADFRARETLLAVDPTNTVLSLISPRRVCRSWRSFLPTGWQVHRRDVGSPIPLMTPEDDRPFFVAVGDLMQHSGIGGSRSGTPKAAAGSPTLATHRREAWSPAPIGAVGVGIQNFSWYTWEGQIGSPLAKPII